MLYKQAQMRGNYVLWWNEHILLLNQNYTKLSFGCFECSNKKIILKIIYFLQIIQQLKILADKIIIETIKNKKLIIIKLNPHKPCHAIHYDIKMFLFPSKYNMNHIQ